MAPSSNDSVPCKSKSMHFGQGPVGGTRKALLVARCALHGLAKL